MPGVTKTYVVEPIDLTPDQADRLVREIAILKAKKAALEAGMSVAEMQAQTWTVDVHPLKPQTD